MIKRPIGLEILEFGIEFNFLKYTKLEIDLSHVNKDGRSSYTKEDIAKVVLHLINEIALESSEVKTFEDEVC